MKRVVVGLIEKDGKYLLVSATKDFGEHTGSYYPPGGHVDDGEDIESALMREIKEELNLEVEPLAEIAVTPSDVAGQITYWWSCKLIGGELSIEKDEIAAANYFSRDEIRGLKLWPATQKFFEEYIF